MFKKKRKKKKDKNLLYTRIIFVYTYFILSIITIALLNNITKTNNAINILKSNINIILNERDVDNLKEELENINKKNEELNVDIQNNGKEIIDIENKTIDIKNNNEELVKQLSSIEGELTENKNNYTNLYSRYEKMTSYVIPNMITFKQYPNYPTGCESVALYILLKYYQVNVSVDNIVDSLPRGKTPYEVNGVLYGGDPNKEFLGNPRSSEGWGIWNKGLSSVANKFKEGIIDGTGMDFNNIYNLIRDNRPVLVWTTVNLKNTYEKRTWISDSTGETITWKKGNHAVVVIGYNNNQIIVSDPIDGRIKYFNKQAFINIYNYMGRRALYY